MEKSDFQRLMERYVKGEVSGEEKRKIESWLDVLSKDDNTDLHLTREEEDRLFARLMSTTEELPAIRPRSKRPVQWIVGVAASIVFVALAAYVAWNFQDTRRHTLDVVSGAGLEKIILNDGSLVWLRPDSKLSYYEEYNEGGRYSTFEGQALFEVAKDKERPFILKCGNINVRVVGTSFNLLAAGDEIELTVLTGKVNVSSRSDAAGIDVLPYEKLTYKISGKVEKMQISHEDIASLTKNTSYDMHFENVPAGEIFSKIENKFNVVVNVSDKKILNCRITADFTDSSLEVSLQMIAEVLGSEYSVDGNLVTIQGKGCS